MQLAAPQAFFDKLRAGLLAPAISQSEVDGLQAILAQVGKWPSVAWAAYGLATAYHETWHTLQPVREVGSDAYLTRMYDPPPAGLHPRVAKELGNIEPGDGVKFCGRGYVQLTGRALYARAGQHLGMPAMTDHPEVALEPSTAAAIMRAGMEQGWFTGRKLADFLPTSRAATRAEFMAARRVINGQDRADQIADYAVSFQEALQLGHLA